MAYVVRIQTGKGKKRSVSQSIPLSNKAKVRKWVSRNPVGNSNTRVLIKNTRTKKTITKSKTGAKIFGWKPKFK